MAVLRSIRRNITARTTRLSTVTTMVAPSMQTEYPIKTSFGRRVKISPDTLKAVFEKTRAERDATETGKKVNKLLDLIVSRMKDGRTENLKNFPTFANIDEAYDAPFHQPATSLIDKIMSKGMDDKGVLAELKAYGISEKTMFTDVTVKVGKTTKTVKMLNEQTFWKVLVPLVKSYVMIRGAKLFNDRNQTPLFKYDPVVNTEATRSICEVITNLVSKMGHMMGFTSVMREMILNSLLYSSAIMFPSEVWYCEMDTDDNGNEFAKKEGLGYQVPHPSRTFIDKQYRPSTINSDTGVTYGGWWRIMRYGDIESNPKFYNKQVIPYGTNWFHADVSRNYFKDVYPCTMAMPGDIGAKDWSGTTGMSGQRDAEAARYKSSQYDTAIFVTDFFQKLVPSEWGLGDWKYPLWFRFVMAADDTVIFAEPYPYCPMLWLGSDVIENRARNSSLALDIVPFQVHIGNTLSQIILGAKQNCAKIIYYDTEIIDESDIEKIKSQIRDAEAVHFVPFSSKNARVSQVSLQQMFVPIQFPQVNTAELTSTLNTIISIMERLLGMSSSEVGAAGAHVQTAEEIKIISTNTSTRVEFTGSYVDEWIDAWKRQIYNAMKAFMDEEFVSEVTATSKTALMTLKQLGFQLGSEVYDGKVQVRGQKSKLVVEGFVSARDGANRINQPQIAQVMMQTIQSIAGSPMLSQVVGAEQIVSALNMAAQLAGAPKDWKLRPDIAQQQLVQTQEMLKNIASQIQQSAVQEALKAAQPLAKEVIKQGKSGEATSAQAKETAGETQALAQSVDSIKSQVSFLQGLVSAALKSIQTAAEQPPLGMVA